MNQRIFIALIILALAGLCFGTEVKITASDAQANDWFGYSASIDSDYTIIGAPFEDQRADRAGAAYIFYRNQGGVDNWGQVKKITASDAQYKDFFGISVSISGDHAAVGAYQEDARAVNAGAAYVYNRNHGGANNWGQVKKLTAPDARSEDQFGSSISICGDYLIVGANQNHNGASGAVYVYYRHQGGTDNWGFVKKITASDALADELFGFSVSLDGDCAVIGAHADNSYTGAAYVFYKDYGGTDNWGEVKKITASDAEIKHYFGWSVSINADCIVVGAIGDSTNGNKSGAAYTFHRNQGGTDNWGEVTKILASDGQADDRFGRAASVHGEKIVVGANMENTERSGAFYTFVWNGSTYYEASKTTASDGSADDHYGLSISIRDDNVVVGADYEDSAGSNAGAAYIYKLILNEPPVADAGPDQSCVTMDTVSFDGSNSYDNNSDVLNYNWQITSKPDSSAAELVSPNTVNPTIQPDVVGEYVITLIVNDGEFDSEPSNVTLSVIPRVIVVRDTLQSVIEFINELPDSSFKNPVFANIITWQLDGVLLNIEQGNYLIAKNILEIFLLKKTDGCAANGSPDRNDWVTDCEAQNQIYPLLVESINLLNDLISGLAKPLSDEMVDDKLPASFQLYQNYPNPFNPVTNIRFNLPKASHVEIIIYDVTGARVAVLLNERKDAGHYNVTFDAGNFSSGMYFYEIKTDEFRQSKKMILMK